MKRRRRRKLHNTVLSPENKHTLTVVLIWCGSVLFAVVLALIIGNALGKASGKIPDSGTVPAIYTYSAGETPPVNAVMLTVSGHTDASFASAVASLNKDVTAVSLCLRDKNRTVLFGSSVASAVSGSVGGTLNLPAAVELLHGKGIYVSCCVEVFSHNAGNELAISAAQDYEAALIAEIADAGVDDIILCGLPSDTAGIARASALFSKIREKHSGVVLGAAIGYAVLLSDSGAYSLEGYSSYADFCALDTAGCRASGTTPTAVAEALLYCFRVYPIRILVEAYGTDDFTAQAAAFNAIGIYNLQYHQSSSAATPAG